MLPRGCSARGARAGQVHIILSPAVSPAPTSHLPASRLSPMPAAPTMPASWFAIAPARPASWHGASGTRRVTSAGACLTRRTFVFCPMAACTSIRGNCGECRSAEHREEFQHSYRIYTIRSFWLNSGVHVFRKTLGHCRGTAERRCCRGAAVEALLRGAAVEALLRDAAVGRCCRGAAVEALL